MRLLIQLLVGVGVVLVGTSCESKVPKTPVVSEHTRTCLAMADADDGMADKVVRKCPACALAMLGHEKFKANLAGYEIHSCSADCNKMLEDDPNALFSKLECKANGDADKPPAN